VRKEEEEEEEEEAGQGQQHEPARRPHAASETEKPIGHTRDSEDSVAGNLKVCQACLIDLDAEIRVIAALRGDIAVGIL
jgi:hypothetical protein